MESGARVLIVADDAPVGRWLQHRIDALGLARSIEVEDGAAFDSRPRGSLSTSFDVLVAALDFAARLDQPRRLRRRAARAGGGGQRR
jgi:hypothetical protein